MTVLGGVSVTAVVAVALVLVINHWLEPWLDRRIKARRTRP